MINLTSIKAETNFVKFYFIQQIVFVFLIAFTNKLFSKSNVYYQLR